MTLVAESGKKKVNEESTHRLASAISPWRTNEIVRAIEEGANPDFIMDGREQTLLHHATARNDHEVMQALFKAGVEIRMNKAGKTPTDFAVLNRETSEESFRLLQEYESQVVGAELCDKERLSA